MESKWLNESCVITDYKDLPEEQVTIIKESFDKLRSAYKEFYIYYGKQRVMEGFMYPEFKVLVHKAMIDMATAAAGRVEVFEEVVLKTTELIIDLFSCFEEGSLPHRQYLQLDKLHTWYLGHMAKHNPNYITTINILWDAVNHVNGRELRTKGAADIFANILVCGGTDTNKVSPAELNNVDQQEYMTGMKIMADNLVQQVAKDKAPTRLKQSRIF